MPTACSHNIYYRLTHLSVRKQYVCPPIQTGYYFTSALVAGQLKAWRTVAAEPDGQVNTQVRAHLAREQTAFIYVVPLTGGPLIFIAVVFVVVAFVGLLGGFVA